MNSAALLPAADAVLNLTSAVLLVAGYRFIRKGNIPAHRRCMLSAFASSILFLGFYLSNHFINGVAYYQRHDWTRPLYFTVLATHTPLAALVPFLALVTLTLGLRNRIARHRRWAKWTLPVWLYVSVTGVVIYLMLYQLPGARLR